MEALTCRVQCSSWPRGAAPSPRWLPSTEPWAGTPTLPLSWTAAATCTARRMREAPRTTARSSSWPMAVARSPPWLRSTAPTVSTPRLPWSGTAAATCTAQRLMGARRMRERSSSSPMAATRSPRWLPSTAPTEIAPRGLIMDSSGDLCNLQRSCEPVERQRLDLRAGSRRHPSSPRWLRSTPTVKAPRASSWIAAETCTAQRPLGAP